MVEGFSLELQEYCSHCGDFELDVEKVEVTSLGKNTCFYITVIKCRNDYKCSRIVENMKNREAYNESS